MFTRHSRKENGLFSGDTFSLCKYVVRLGLGRMIFPGGALCTTESPPGAETLIERIYREETGHRMPNSIKRILLRKPTAKHKPR